MYILPTLPLAVDLETKVVLKKLAAARAALAELKGVAQTIPNETILIHTLSLQEARQSSAVENIVTTQDDLYRAEVSLEKHKLPLAIKEVQRYVEALLLGYTLVREERLLTNRTIKSTQRILEGNRAGFREVPGTNLQDSQGRVVYTPPQSNEEIVAAMSNLERFINEDELCDWDPLLKLAIIHHQFESIHPFYDGNGRTGRILNVLYLVQQGLLDLPILYLSRYIIRNKARYYELLQRVRDEGAWQDWVLYMLSAIEDTAKETTWLIHAIAKLQQQYKERIKREAPKIYSHELLNNLFRYPYTKKEFLMAELGKSDKTVASYLKLLLNLRLLERIVVERKHYYVNSELVKILQQGAGEG